MPEMELNKKGFTLIEMMAVVVIISIMSMMLINNYNFQRRTKEMQFAIQKIADDARKAQNYSISIKKFESYDISGGYGVHFETEGSSYVIFLNSPSADNKAYISGEDQIVETVFLPQNIFIDNLNGTLNNADVLFEPPYGKVDMTLNGTLQPSGSGSLRVEIKRNPEGCPDFCKTVAINSQGQIK